MRSFFTRDLTKYRTDFILSCLLVIIALSVRVFFLYAIDSPFIFFKYLVFAHQIVHGQDIGERVLDVSPFYLSFMTFMVKYFNADSLYIKFVQLLFGVGNCVFIFTIGKKLLTRKIAFIGALIYAMYGNIIVLEATLEPLVFEIWFNLLAIYCLLCIQAEGISSFKVYLDSMLAGLFAGLSIITKPNFILFLPIAIIWLLFLSDNPKTFQKRSATACLFFVMTAATVSPVTIRNYVKFHDLVLVTADYGKVFFHGNASTATGFAMAYLPNQDIDPTGKGEPDYAHVTFRTVASQAVGKQLLPSEAARFWVNVTLHDITSQPIKYLFLELKKIHLFFHTYERSLLASSFWGYKKSLAYPFLRYGIISSLALVGMVLARKQFKLLFLLYGGVSIYLLSNLIFFVTARYRSPAVPYLCLFAGYAIAAIIELVRGKKYNMVGICLFSFIGLLAVNYLPYKQEILNLEKSMQQTYLNSLQYRRFE